MDLIVPRKTYAVHQHLIGRVGIGKLDLRASTEGVNRRRDLLPVELRMRMGFYREDDAHKNRAVLARFGSDPDPIRTANSFGRHAWEDDG